MKEYRYKHIGYYNEVGDIASLINANVNKIIDYYKEGDGNFFKTKVHEEDNDIILANEQDSIAKGYLRITDDGKYAVSFDVEKDFLDKYENVEDSESSGCFIDIYERYLFDGLFEENIKDDTDFDSAGELTDMVESIFLHNRYTKKELKKEFEDILKTEVEVSAYTKGTDGIDDSYSIGWGDSGLIDVYLLKTNEKGVYYITEIDVIDI